MFALSTILSWSLYGSRSFEFLFGHKGGTLYQIIYVFCIVLGAAMKLDLVWTIADTFNGLMMIPNLIGVVSLCPLVVKITRNYIDRRLNGKNEKPILSYDAQLQKEAEEKIANE